MHKASLLYNFKQKQHKLMLRSLLLHTYLCLFLLVFHLPIFSPPTCHTPVYFPTVSASTYSSHVISLPLFLSFLSLSLPPVCQGPFFSPTYSTYPTISASSYLSHVRFSPSLLLVIPLPQSLPLFFLFLSSCSFCFFFPFH